MKKDFIVTRGLDQEGAQLRNLDINTFNSNVFIVSYIFMTTCTIYVLLKQKSTGVNINKYTNSI